MTVSWLSHDCLMTVSWLPHDSLMTQKELFRIQWAMGQCRVGPCFSSNPKRLYNRLVVCSFVRSSSRWWKLWILLPLKMLKLSNFGCSLTVSELSLVCLWTVSGLFLDCLWVSWLSLGLLTVSVQSTDCLWNIWGSVNRPGVVWVQIDIDHHLAVNKWYMVRNYQDVYPYLNLALFFFVENIQRPQFFW